MLRMNGAVPIFSLYVFMARTGISLPSHPEGAEFLPVPEENASVLSRIF
jgi:hypothetical protein